MNNDGKKQTLRDVTVTLSGLELVRCLREFVDARCDALGLQSADDWASVVRSLEAPDLLEKHAELKLRGDLRSLVAAKEFAFKVCAGESLFTRQGDEPNPFVPSEKV